jgi:hypothetical protein
LPPSRLPCVKILRARRLLSSCAHTCSN